MRTLPLLALAGVSLLLSVASTLAKPTQPAVVQVSPLSKTKLSDVLTFPARVVPAQEGTLLAESDGVITEIKAPLGTQVARGSTVLAIKNTDPVYQYKPLRMTAPLTGVVSQMLVTEGTQVTRGQKLAVLTNSKQMKLAIEVPASELSKLAAGAKGEFKVPHAEKVAQVRIIGMSPTVDPSSGTASAELEFVLAKKTDVSPWPAGVLGRASFETNIRQGYKIPEHAVQFEGEKTFVRVLEAGNKVKNINVELGARSRGQVEILAGLDGSYQLVERSSRFTQDGETVETQAPKK